jgi:Tim17/Tim22/Tim23/Pmp24 family
MLPYLRDFSAKMILTCYLIIQAIGGSVWHGIKGFRNSPYGERRIGALTAIKARAPVLGGNFGVWGGLFSTFDCAVKGIRKKEDPYNASMYPMPRRVLLSLVWSPLLQSLTGLKSLQDSLQVAHWQLEEA